MNKRKLYTLSLLFIVTPMLVWSVTSSSPYGFFFRITTGISLFDSLPFPQGCTPFIIQKDTSICEGATVTLKLADPPPPDSMPGVWKLLIDKTAIDSILFNIRPFGYNRTNQYLYAVMHKRITRYDLKNKAVTVINANNWPGDYTEFTYDYTNKRLLCWRAGRDSVYALPENGGNWTALSDGYIDRECYGASSFWNPLTNRAGFYGGFGFGMMKNWIYENTASGWIEKRPNPVTDTIPKGGNLIGANGDGSKLYLFSGQGSATGNELDGCSSGSPWATANGRLCWLKDLWELDLSNYSFKNILPVNNKSIQYEGAAVYDYDKSRFFIFGGYQPTDDYVVNQTLPNTNKTFRFRRNVDTGFAVFQGEGDLPPALPPGSVTNSYAYYDPVDKRIIWARYDGIWAYYPDSSLSPASRVSILWSTGETTNSINVKPSQTTQYKVTRTVGGITCADSITISVTNLKTALQKNLSICADSILLDAGTGFNSYLWSTGATTQTIYAKQNGKYKVTIGKGLCTLQDSSQLVIAPPVKDFIVSALKDSICTGETDSLYVAIPQAGVNYAWTIAGNSTVLRTGADFLTPGILKDITFAVVGSSNASICATKNGSVKIAVRSKLPKPILRMDSIGLAVLRFKWDMEPAATGYAVSLDRGNSYQAPSSGALGLTHTVSGLQPNDLVSMSIRTIGRYACETSDTAQLTVRTQNPFGNGIYVPNAFTPNGDGVNDVFLVYGTAIASIRLLVYNQWGALVFETTDIKKGWDGMYKDAKAQAGPYTYAMEAVMLDGSKVRRNGSFTLIR